MNGTRVSTLESAVPPRGLVPPSTPGGRPGFLSDVVVELGFADADTVEQAVRAARSPGTTLERVLVEAGALTEEQLAHAVAERYGIDYVALGSFAVDGGATDLIEPAAARRYQAVPVGIVENRLLVAMADPAAALGVNEIAAMTGMEVRPAVASRPALDALLDALPLGGAEAAVFLPEAAEPERPAEEATELRARVERLEARLAESEARRGELEERLAELERSLRAAERIFDELRGVLSRN